MTFIREDLVTICIPTYRRPELLRLAVDSCLAQAYRPLQILIGDDSQDQLSFEVTGQIPLPKDVSLHHVVYDSRMGQSGNVNWLFAHAEGQRLVLLHDDDLLCPGGLGMMIDVWAAHPGVMCVYGKQLVISHAGETLEAETAEFSAQYDRTAEREGIQTSALTSALTWQFPNNAFLLETRVARAVGYLTEAEVGDQVDGDFAIRLALRPGCTFYYLDQFVSAVRQTQNSILRSRVNHGHHLFYESVRKLKVAPADAQARDLCLRRLSAEAVLDAGLAGNRKLALDILRSRFYRLKLLDPRTLFRLLIIAAPRAGGWLHTRLAPNS
jgi:glycosyltransferase involved in cell wall biosynthesis